VTAGKAIVSWQFNTATENPMAYVIVWEFRVRPGMQRQFEEACGFHGEWVRLFRQDPAYIRTELIQDVREARRYLTLDFWASEAAYEAFRENRKDEYKSIDARYEQMTESEREVGRFFAFDADEKRDKGSGTTSEARLR
jgi:heme-degrading monooxygenase HmoA